MKKLVSVLLAVVMAFSVCSVAMIPAMAKDPVISPSEGMDVVSVVVKVNGRDTIHVEYERSEDNPNEITLTYTGEGNLKDWEFVPSADGTNIEIVGTSGNSITVIVHDGDIDKITVNAIVEGDDDGKDEDNDNKSPATGAVAATGLVAAGVGVAILSILKKKNDAE